MGDETERWWEERTREARSDPRTAHELISQALAEPDEDAAWELVRTLHYRGTREVFDAASQLCRSECPQERGLGADVVGQIGIPEHSFPEETLELLLSVLDVERDDQVIDLQCTALGHLHDRRAINSLVRFSTHPSSNVRLAVTRSLHGFEDGLAIATLIELTNDRDEVVRDWATFGLGSQIDTDTPEIREALFARVFDEDEVTRGEALVGLARRKDARIVEPLIRELARYPNTEYLSYSVEAAEELGDPRLLPILTKLKASAGPAVTRFDDAIQNCTGSGIVGTNLPA